MTIPMSLRRVTQKACYTLLRMCLLSGFLLPPPLSNPNHQGGQRESLKRMEEAELCRVDLPSDVDGLINPMFTERAVDLMELEKMF